MAFLTGSWKLKNQARCAVVAAGFLALLMQTVLPGTAAVAKTLPEITSTKISFNAKKTRFSAELNYAVGYNVYVLQNPYRVIIDIPDAIFNLPASNGIRGSGLISGYRFGQLDERRSRIVLDVTGPVLIQNSYAVRSKPGKPARLIVDLIATDEKTFKNIHQVDQVANLVAKEQARKLNEPLIPKDLPPISDNAAPRDSINALLKGKKPKNSKKPVSKIRTKYTIVIDPGHGGIDSGTSSKSGVEEKNVVLQFSKALKKRLQSSGRYKVFLTRSGDEFLRLRDRVKVAHTKKADLFIAIHADAIKYKNVRGTTLYTLSETASDAEAAELAAKENRADIIGGVNLGGESKEITNILIELAQRETKNHSVYFARKSVRQLRGVTRLAKRPLRAAGFVVLKAPDVPSVLLELGYLSNNHDAKLLTSKKWQRRVSRALSKAIDDFFRARVALQ
jgi:N-acetylmuramoyl-L-alanine amidase